MSRVGRRAADPRMSDLAPTTNVVRPDPGAASVGDDRHVDRNCADRRRRPVVRLPDRLEPVNSVGELLPAMPIV